MDLDKDDTVSNLLQFMNGNEKRIDDCEDDNDMEMTDMLANEILQKRSFSFGGKGSRHPLYEVPTTPPHPATSETSFISSNEGDNSQGNHSWSSHMSLTSATEGDPDMPIPIEYTILMGRATAPALENPAWLALRGMT